MKRAFGASWNVWPGASGCNLKAQTTGRASVAQCRCAGTDRPTFPRTPSGCGRVRADGAIKFQPSVADHLARS